MRRSAQFVIQQGGENTFTLTAIDAAHEEMVLLGGVFNLKLLGAELVAPRKENVIRVIAGPVG